MKPRRLWLLVCGLILIAASLACGLGAGAPPEDGYAPPAEPAATQAVQPTPPGSESIPDGGGGPEPAAAIPEARRVTLEYPSAIRAGDSDVIRLTLEVDDLGNVTPTAVIGGNVVKGEVIEIPNLYETHNVVAEARLDLAGVEVRPEGVVNAPLEQGQSATFFWSVRPSEAGTFRGTVWLYLLFIPKAGGEETRLPVSAQLIEINSTSLFGLGGNAARAVGAIGSLIGSVLGFPFFGDIVRFLWKRRRKK
ncbi:MAG: hypothetical protein AB1564_13045 [Chloroflexota bacterium]